MNKWMLESWKISSPLYGLSTSHPSCRSATCFQSHGPFCMFLCFTAAGQVNAEKRPLLLPQVIMCLCVNVEHVL